MMSRCLLRWPLTCAVALGLFLNFDGASAQACLGYPQGRVGALTASASFPDAADGYTMAALVSSAEDGVFLEGEFGIVTPDEEELENIKHGGGVLAYEVGALAPGASVCPFAGGDYTWISAIKTWSVPFGISVGATIPLSSGGSVGLTPFARPQFVYVRTTVEGFDGYLSDIYVGLSGGLTLNFGAFMIAGTAGKIFEEDEDALFSVTVGAAWR